jgi:CheY-like chemotaxis protein
MDTGSLIATAREATRESDPTGAIFRCSDHAPTPCSFTRHPPCLHKAVWHLRGHRARDGRRRDLRHDLLFGSLVQPQVASVDRSGSGVILVVDDEDSILQLAQAALEAAGYTVLLASDGRSALDVMAGSSDRLCAVLLDLTMPGMTGEETLKYMREMRPTIELAVALARFKGTEAATLFPSGYAANVGTILALAGPGDHLITDILAHASILDGCQLAGSKIALFRHNDMLSLERRLASASGRKLVIVEGVYSMDGDMAPLAEVAELCRKHHARLMADEAHSAFVYGADGRGAAEHFGVEGQVDVHLGTLSKSLGGMGGYVAGSQALIDYLRAYARSHVFSCALSPPVVGGVSAALRIAEAEPELRARLWDNVAVAQGIARRGRGRRPRLRVLLDQRCESRAAMRVSLFANPGPRSILRLWGVIPRPNLNTSPFCEPIIESGGFMLTKLLTCMDPRLESMTSSFSA